MFFRPRFSHIIFFTIISFPYVFNPALLGLRVWNPGYVGTSGCRCNIIQRAILAHGEDWVYGRIDQPRYAKVIRGKGNSFFNDRVFRGFPLILRFLFPAGPPGSVIGEKWAAPGISDVEVYVTFLADLFIRNAPTPILPRWYTSHQVNFLYFRRNA